MCIICTGSVSQSYCHSPIAVTASNSGFTPNRHGTVAVGIRRWIVGGSSQIITKRYVSVYGKLHVCMSVPMLLIFIMDESTWSDQSFAF